MRAISPARRVAFDVLRRVEEERAFASVLLVTATEGLSNEDRALCYELVLGVLRWQLWLDELTKHLAGRSADKLDLPVCLALRLGLYQIRFLERVPNSAAVNESVNLAYEARVRSAAGFINAVLRRATHETDYDPAACLADPIERIAVATSHPAWLIERWIAAFGKTEAEAFARANNEHPPVAFRVNEACSEKALVISKLQAAARKLEASQIAPGAWRIEGATALVRSLAREGFIYLQDEASQMVAHVLDARPNDRVLDACAAPGSKTTHIAALSGDKARVIAGDIHERRLRIVREQALKQRLSNVHPVAFNAEGALPFANGYFDCVLVDAPCTGTGTLRRNPEIRWRITEAGIRELAGRQLRILLNVARMTRRGGRLVYSTCSVEPDENEHVVAGFLDVHRDFLQITAAVPAHLLTGSGAARTWPQCVDTDGFFVAAFERTSYSNSRLREYIQP